MITFKASIKQVFVSGLTVILCLAMIYWFLDYPVCHSQEKKINGKTQSHSKEQEDWLAKWRADFEEDQLYLYAKKLFKTQVDCKAKVTDTYNGQNFGTLLFIFAGDNELKLETFPPESSRITFRVPKGFPDEQEAHMVLEQYVRKIGVSLDWSKPEQNIIGTERILSFNTLESGDNATAFQVYQNRMLIEIGFSKAL